jgi:hypothetical protein
MEFKQDIALLRQTPLFDAEWYRTTYADVAMLNMRPEEHYLRYGAGLGRDPSPDFDTAFYRAQNPDLPAEANPLLHFLRHGRKDGRLPRRAGREAHPVAVMRAAMPQDRTRLEAEYRARGLHREPDRFVLHRIIGNDLYPRHERGQTRRNLAFLLEHEPPLRDCKKRWVVNRIVDPGEEAGIIALLERHGQEYLHLRFEPDVYRTIGWDTGLLPSPDFLDSDAFRSRSESQQNRLLTALYRLKNNYVMNNNGARNAALADGRARGKWALPWDGNCFVTASAWDEIRRSVTGTPMLKYFAVPMHRILDNAALLADDFTPDPVEEPQLLFRRDAAETFDPRAPYGRRPKVEMFWRLGIPGKWDEWPDDAWDQPRRPLSVEAGQFGVAGWVARMFSGHGAQEEAAGASQRHSARQDAIISTIDAIDRGFGLPSCHPGGIGEAGIEPAAAEAG